MKSLKDSIHQTVHFSRTAVKDKVTGKVTYNAWTPVSGKWDAMDAPKIDGYEPNPKSVPEVDVTPDTQSTEFNIMYTAIGKAIVINFVDTENGNSVADTISFNGLVGQKPNIDLTEKENALKARGYVIGDNTIPASVTFSDQAQTYEVRLTHGVVTDISESNPQGVSDLTKDVIRTINFVTNNQEVLQWQNRLHKRRIFQEPPLKIR